METLPSFRLVRIKYGDLIRRKEEPILEEKLRLLFDFQKFEKNAELQAVIDAAHARHVARPLSDDEVESVAAAGMPGATKKKKDPREDWT